MIIDIVVDISITKALYSIYDLDRDGFVCNTTTVKTLKFDYPYPVIDFLEPIFMNFFENMNSQYIYMTAGYDIKEDEHYLRFNKEKFIEFIKTNKTYISSSGCKHKIDDYYAMGLTIFDENFKWLIHNNVDVGDITFSYQQEKFNEVEILLKNKWFSPE